MNYQQLLNKIKSKENFTFSRFGDGEVNCIMGDYGNPTNCDGHQYFRAMGMALYKVIKSKPMYYMGLQPLVQRLRGEDEDFKELIEGVNWIDSDIIHNASIKHGLNDLFEALKERNIILIGNEDLYEMALKIGGSMVDPVMHIIISKVDAWNEFDQTIKRLREIIRKDDVVLYCAGMMSGVMMDQIYSQVGNNVTQIDIGSAFDPYCGIKSRSYHHKLEI